MTSSLARVRTTDCYKGRHSVIIGHARVGTLDQHEQLQTDVPRGRRLRTAVHRVRVGG
jgi:hypothetical protein